MIKRFSGLGTFASIQSEILSLVFPPETGAVHGSSRLYDQAKGTGRGPHSILDRIEKRRPGQDPPLQKSARGRTASPGRRVASAPIQPSNPSPGHDRALPRSVEGRQ